MIWGMTCRILGEFDQRAGRDHLAQGRIVFSKACGEIDDAAVDHGAVSGLAAGGIGCDAGWGHEASCSA